MTDAGGIDGLEKLKKVFEIIAAWESGQDLAGFGNVRESVNAAVFEHFAEQFYDDLIEAFASESNPVTKEKWAPIKYRDGKILYLSGEMYRQALAAVSAGLRGRTRDRAEFLMLDPFYAETHQFGDPGRNIVARPFFGVSPETTESTGNKLLEEIVSIALR